MSYGWHEGQGKDRGDRQRLPPVVGVFLILLGVFFLASEQLSFDFGRYGWPMFVIVPGVLLLLVGLAIPHEGGLGAAIPGGIVTTVGLLLAFQAATDTYASWAYGWALVAPGSVGVTLTLFGLIHSRRDLLDAGLRTAAVGFGLFVGFGLLFENLIGIDDAHSNSVLRDALPVMAVVLGVLIVTWNLLPSRPSGRPESDGWPPVETPAPPETPAG